MKTVAYLCSYKDNEIESLADLKNQREKIQDYCLNNSMEISDYYYEQNSGRADFKPVLLHLISSTLVHADRIVIYSPEKVSVDLSFREWIDEELSRMKIELFYVINRKDKSLRKKLVDIKDRVKNIPSLPQVVTKVIQLVQDKHSSAQELGKVISKDAGLTTRVLRLVNSSYYGFSRQISTIQQAITILGFTTIRGLVLSSSVFKLFQPTSEVENIFDYSSFWKHSLLTAIGSKYLAELINMEKSEDIFSAAILHDLGKIILYQYDYQNYAKAYAINFRSFDFDKNIENEEKFCKTNHCEIAYFVANSWNLPDTILQVMLNHHTPQLGHEYSTACAIVYVCDILSNFVLDGRPLDIEIFDLDFLNKVGIRDEEIYMVYDRIFSEMDSVKDVAVFFK